MNYCKSFCKIIKDYRCCKECPKTCKCTGCNESLKVKNTLELIKLQLNGIE